MLRIHSTVLRHHTTPNYAVGGVGWFRRVTVVIAPGKRPVPFRTRKLSLVAPMVLQSKGCGRVGHRRTHSEHPRAPVENPTVLPGPRAFPHPTPDATRPETAVQDTIERWMGRRRSGEENTSDVVVSP